MTETTGRRRDGTRQQILHAAAHQFATRAYHEVGLDDILAEADLTKGAMYFHFSSKHALATAVIEEWVAAATALVQDLLTRRLSGLETLVDFCYQIAIQGVTEDEARAALNLLGSVGHTDGLQAKLLPDWIEAMVHIARRAIAEGDISEECPPGDLGRVLVSLYLGMRQTSNLDQPEQFLLDLERNLLLVLLGTTSADRVDYFRQFIRRRTALAIRATAVRNGSG